MKKLFILAVCSVIALASCQDKKGTINPAELQNDSLRAIIEARDSELDAMMASMNQIQQGFDEISKAEDRITLAKQGEGMKAEDKIREDIKFIAQRMAENRQLIKDLQAKLQATGFKGEEMQKTINKLIAEVNAKDAKLKQLQAELEAKNIHIKELDETIEGLNTDVKTLKTDKENLTTEKKNLETDKANLQTESKQKSETISAQDAQLNTAWYVFGTKKELKEQRILASGEVLKSSFNKDYFTKIDIRNVKELKLYSKKASLLTSHPSSSYSLVRDASDNYILKIQDPQLFWSTSKYLVVQVK
ncbi:hypothetical protein [Prevotella sp. HUN102]|uniref:Cbp1 family collagen-binding glycoprotein adhesin n=1 Tax=Prevotella sp. HUN102 TaxID=1392486 RepID=UPI00048ED535|nr:hypothetical protein [Prevotella sp. HUN102]